MTDIEKLKFNLRETPDESVFTDEELQNLLIMCDGNINLASYQGCLMKASPEKKITVGGIAIEHYDMDYWISLSEMYYKLYQNEGSGSYIGGRYKTHMARADEV